MNDRQAKLVAGSLLHDLGKVVCSGNRGDSISQRGLSFLKDTVGIQDADILDCVRYRGGEALRNAALKPDSSVYLVCLADKMAALVAPERMSASEEAYDRTIPLDCSFNYLNRNNIRLANNIRPAHYSPAILGFEDGVNYPTEDPVSVGEPFYRGISDDIAAHLRDFECDEGHLNSLLTVLEKNLSYIPSSTSRDGMRDISLYDHIKLTAAMAACMDAYLAEKGVNDFKPVALDRTAETYKEKMFLLYTLDISGIQSFIYTISSEGALKGLRARSFYLEILMEHIVDCLLADLGLSRTNLVYCGGGRCSLLLPNTESTRLKIKSYIKETNKWFMDNFGTALFIAGGGSGCCANDLRDTPQGSYKALYKNIYQELSSSKSHRYCWDEIRSLNSRATRGERECKICRRADKLDTNDRCRICAALENFSRDILFREFFVVMRGAEGGSLPLPNGCCLVACRSEDEVRTKKYVRFYTKNMDHSVKLQNTHLWVGCYTRRSTFDEFADGAKEEGAIRRIGVLRADVDNLGATFAIGFGGRANISRTAALSRRLSLFFKFHINSILQGTDTSVVYSGGDDIFLVGAWNHIVDVFQSLRDSFSKFTRGSLTISGGIGLYDPGYPIHVMAEETQRLEDAAKSLSDKDAICLFDPAYNNGGAFVSAKRQDKDAICLFDPAYSYKWDRFIGKVMNEKFAIIKAFFDSQSDYGKSFLYHLLQLIGGEEKKTSLVRMIYLLCRMEPADGKKDAYRVLKEKLLKWISTEEDKEELETAIHLYIYQTRNKDKKEE